MTLADYRNAIKNLGWELCEIKASGELKELVREDDDLNGSDEHVILAYLYLV